MENCNTSNYDHITEFGVAMTVIYDIHGTHTFSFSLIHDNKNLTYFFLFAWDWDGKGYVHVEKLRKCYIEA